MTALEHIQAASASLIDAKKAGVTFPAPVDAALWRAIEQLGRARGYLQSFANLGLAAPDASPAPPSPQSRHDVHTAGLQGSIRCSCGAVISVEVEVKR